MQNINIENIQSAVDNAAAIDVVWLAAIAHCLGDLKSSMPTEMLFGVDDYCIAGDGRLKSAYSDQYPYFCIKVETGFAISRDDGASGILL